MKRIIISLLLMLFIFFKYYDNRDTLEPIAYDGVDVIKLSPPSLQVFYRTIQYSDKYNVPTYISFGMVREETSYRNPFQWAYRPNQISSGNAYGSYQILLSTARWFWDKNITKEDLLYDIDLNSEIGIAYVKDKYDSYGDWRFALGRYNTGHKVINDYALKIYYNIK